MGWSGRVVATRGLAIRLVGRAAVGRGGAVWDGVGGLSPREDWRFGWLDGLLWDEAGHLGSVGGLSSREDWR